MSDLIVWPLVSNVIRRRLLNHTFGNVRRYSDGRRKPHQGWDFEARVGEPAYAIATGMVEFVRDQGDMGLGLQVCMSFRFQGKTLYALYAHLQHAYVKEGQRLVPNDFVGACGKSGNARNQRAADDHLHFEVRTMPRPGLGLTGRLSPLVVFEKCPLYSPIPG
jgi:peptidoglycan LD-endopeptidase LytH